MKPTNQQARVHFAIRAKRLLGRWVPQSGPIEDADTTLTQMRNRLINSRVPGYSGTSLDVQNLITVLKTTRDIPRALNIYGSSNSPSRRRAMTARRIAHRLGLIEERADETEKHLHASATYSNWRWATVNDLMLTPHIRLQAGTEVSYAGGGEFRYEPGSITLTAKQSREARVTRYKNIRRRII